MSDNLGKDSTWRKDLQDPSMTGGNAYTFKHAGSGDKRPGSDQPSSGSRKKTKKEIDKDHREKKKAEHTKLEEENKELRANKEELRASNHRLVGQVELLTSQQETMRKENASLITEKAKISQKLITIEELLERKTIALNAKHARAQELKRQLKVFKVEPGSGMQERNRDIGMGMQGRNLEMNSMLETNGQMNTSALNTVYAPVISETCRVSDRDKEMNALNPVNAHEMNGMPVPDRQMNASDRYAQVMPAPNRVMTESYAYVQDSSYNQVHVCVNCLSQHAVGACPQLSNH